MDDFRFLLNYVSTMTKRGQTSFALFPGIITVNAFTEIEHRLNLKIPQELFDFYTFSNGAILGEYEILPISQIPSALGELHSLYDDMWISSLLPFAYVSGVGDWIMLDLKRITLEGTSIIDGFHEVPPETWKVICYGLPIWLEKMCASNFRPFWKY
ncbi:MAG: SMI1/KNR4 family protein [Caldilineaceae bacterium]|nr:SMI1/KNR4 family protein [Caldilineaceae bacterium]MCB9148590.1 SMI1/KNR4 family protein [Caldilineaceae bacterium]